MNPIRAWPRRREGEKSMDGKSLENNGPEPRSSSTVPLKKIIT